MNWEEAVEQAKDNLGYHYSEYLSKGEWRLVIDEAKEIIRDDLDYDYNEYMQSSAWKNLRKNVFNRDNRKCVDCGEYATECHHESYANFGEGFISEMEDCISLCFKCHGERHGNFGRQNYKTVKQNLNDKIIVKQLKRLIHYITDEEEAEVQEVFTKLEEKYFTK